MAAGPHSAPVPERDPLERVRRRTASLDPIFNPRTVAVLGVGGATDAAGTSILATLARSGFAGKLLAVGLDAEAVPPGVETCPRVPANVDLAVVTAPPDRVLDALGQCIEAGVQGAILTLSGRSKEGPRSALNAEMRQLLRGSRLRVLGPNCSLLMNPALALNISSGAPLPLGGTIAFISQSGALCHAILEWSFREIIGFSAFLSVGGMVDVDWGDLIDHFGADPNTRSIILFMETVSNARSLLSAAREVALNKPIIVVKAGASDIAARIIAAHTGSLPGNDEVLDAALRRVGVLRVNTIAELFSMADVLSKQPRPRGPRLGIVSNAAGLSALAADSVAGAGAELPSLSPETCEHLLMLLGSRWRTENPVHVPRGAAPETYAKAARLVLRDPGCDGLLLLTSPEGMADPGKPAEMLVGMENPANKPILACLMGVAESSQAQQLAARACLPAFTNPHLAARAFGYMWQYAYNLRAIYETPMPRGNPLEGLLREMAARTIAAARAAARTELTTFESMQLLTAYGIAAPETRTAACEDDAVRLAAELGFPVTLQMNGPAIAGCSAAPFLLPDVESVRSTWRFLAALAERGGAGPCTVTLEPYVASPHCEMRVASSIDPQFGPVLLFGAAGRLGAALHDRTLALPPLNATLAERMIARTRIYSALQADRSALDLLLTLLVRFSQLVTEQRWIQAIEIDPILLTPRGCVARKARVALHALDVAEHQLPRPAIRPYPVQYVAAWRTRRGDDVTIRPIQAEDEPLMIRFHEGLSESSVYLRYFQMVGLRQRTAHDRLTRICFIDYDREMALVAERRDPATGERRIVGLGNLGRVRGRNEAEVAVIVSDDYQGHGLGTELMRRLIHVARAEKMSRVVGSTMFENTATIALLKRVGFQVSRNYEERVVEAEMKL